MISWFHLGLIQFFLVSLYWTPVALECHPGSVVASEIHACVLCGIGEYWRSVQLKISIVLSPVLENYQNMLDLV